MEQDLPISLLEAQEPTLLIEGCGNRPASGYTYCRLVEGSIESQKIMFHFPPVTCGSDKCIHLKIINAHGLAVIGLSLNKMETRLDVSWEKLLERKIVQSGDRGIWIALAEIRFTEGSQIKKITLEGEIRVRVLPMGYLSLSTIENDSSYYWEWNDKNNLFKMNKGGQTFVRNHPNVSKCPWIVVSKNKSPFPC